MTLYFRNEAKSLEKTFQNSGKQATQCGLISCELTLHDVVDVGE